jgi:hypothetical protein
VRSIAASVGAVEVVAGVDTHLDLHHAAVLSLAVSCSARDRSRPPGRVPSELAWFRSQSEVIRAGVEQTGTDRVGRATWRCRADRLTTRRVSTVGVDSVAHGSITPENATVPTDPVQAATNGTQGTNCNGWPRRTPTGGLAAPWSRNKLADRNIN